MIYLTAGHRGKGTGAKGLIDEGAEAAALRDAVTLELVERGAAVLNDNDTDSLTKVIADINKACTPHDILVDIHFNAFNGRAHGTEVLIPHNATAAERETAENVLLATTSALGTRCRGVKDAKSSQHSRLAILEDTRCHSVLLEVCFCDSEVDAMKYRLSRDRLVSFLADTLERHGKTEPMKRYE